jgi:phosphatidate cytidylyltransferase
VAVSPVAANKPKGWALGLRVASGVLFVPLLIALAHAGGLAFLGFVALQTTLGLVEFYRLMQAKGHAPVRWLGHATALVLLAVAYRPHTPYGGFLLTGSLVLLLALALRHPERRGIVESAAVTAFGVLYVGWLSAHFVLLRELPWRAGLDYRDGTAFVLYAFLITWSCDTGAYLVGRAFGRTRPFARISPRKTLEGSLGGFAAAVVAGVAGALTFMRPEGGAPWLEPWQGAVAGALVGVAGQVGDLIESLFKRDAEAGDASDLIPGHGGILDRFDSLYLGAPVVFHFLSMVVFRLP